MDRFSRAATSVYSFRQLTKVHQPFSASKPGWILEATESIPYSALLPGAAPLSQNYLEAAAVFFLP